MKSTHFKKALKIIRLVWIAAGLSFIVWNFVSFQAQGVDASIFASNATVTVECSSTTDRFTPIESTRDAPKQVGLIFYPGAMVDPNAYFPLLKEIAANGYPVRLIHLPYRLASFPAQVDELFQTTLDTIQGENEGIVWVIGGHSKGAALATKFAHAHPQAIAGLALIATTHPKDADTDLSSFAQPTLKIYATQDGLASPAEIQEYSYLLPAATQFVKIEGGNHAHFGYYGEQVGDDRATISRQQQQEQTLEAMLDFLSTIQSGS